MGVHHSLNIGDFTILDGGKYISLELLFIFNHNEFQTISEVIDDEVYCRYVYKSSLKKIKRRLHVMGFSLQQSKVSFKNNKQKFRTEHLIEIPKGWSFNLWFKEIKNAIKQKLWGCRAEKLNKNLAYIFDYRTEIPLGFPCSDLRSLIRALLEIFSEEEEVILDVTELIANGDYIHSATSLDTLSKILILPEGSFDHFVLEKTLTLLYPDLKKYFSFLDFSNSRTAGGVGQLVNIVKAFIGSGIQEKIIAIFDNDSSAYDDLRSLTSISLP